MLLIMNANYDRYLSGSHELMNTVASKRGRSRARMRLMAFLRETDDRVRRTIGYQSEDQEAAWIYASYKKESYIHKKIIVRHQQCRITIMLCKQVLVTNLTHEYWLPREIWQTITGVAILLISSDEQEQVDKNKSKFNTYRTSKW